MGLGVLLLEFGGLAEGLATRVKLYVEESLVLVRVKYQDIFAVGVYAFYREGSDANVSYG